MVGAVSNPDNQNTNLGVGRNRWLGKRPLTRGVAKNPVDHPHGGGEGQFLAAPVTRCLLRASRRSGCAYAPQQVDRQDDHPVASREEEEVSHGSLGLEGSFRDLHLSRKPKRPRTAAAMPRIKTTASVHHPATVRAGLNVYNGRKFVPVSVNEDMVNEAGEFALTRFFPGHAADKKGNANGKKKSPCRVADNEALLSHADRRRFGAEANPPAALIRGRKVEDATG